MTVQFLAFLFGRIAQRRSRFAGPFSARLGAVEPTSYARLHSRRADKWYGGDAHRYDYDYNDRELNEWLELMNAARERTEEVLFLFNNCYRGQAVSNARRLRQLIEEQMPTLPVVAPFAERPPEQRSLFD